MTALRAGSGLMLLVNKKALRKPVEICQEGLDSSVQTNPSLGHPNHFQIKLKPWQRKSLYLILATEKLHLEAVKQLMKLKLTPE